MDIEQFEASLSADAPTLSPPLLAMWHATRGDWEAAHSIVQAENDADAAWVHAWLHRLQGDLGNARYWYRRAGAPSLPKPRGRNARRSPPRSSRKYRDPCARPPRRPSGERPPSGACGHLSGPSPASSRGTCRTGRMPAPATPIAN